MDRSTTQRWSRAPDDHEPERSWEAVGPVPASTNRTAPTDQMSLPRGALATISIWHDERVQMGQRFDDPRLTPLRKALLIGLLLLVLVTSLVAVDRKMSAATLPPQPHELPSTLIERLPPLKLPGPGEKAVFFGDSWTLGSSAVPETLGYAYLTGQRLGAVTEVDAARGTGYVNNGADQLVPGTANVRPNPVGTYRERLLVHPTDPSVRLVVLQGGISDLQFRGRLEAAAVETMRTAIERFPNAQIVVLGPAPSQPEEIDAVRSLAVEIMSAAATLGLYMINPAGQGWITSHNMDSVIDPMTRTPTTQGHAYLTDKLVESLNTLARDGQPKI